MIFSSPRLPRKFIFIDLLILAPSFAQKENLNYYAFDLDPKI